MIITTLNGWSPDRFQNVVSSMLVEAALPSVTGEFKAAGFVTDGEASPESLTAIAAYFAPVTLITFISKSIIQVDVDTDNIYKDVLGNRCPEYLDAEVAANTFKNAGYIGVVPEDVQCYASVKGWTPQQAADDILLIANAWRPAKTAIRANRLLAKEAITDSLSYSEVEAVLAWWAIFVLNIRTQLEI